MKKLVALMMMLCLLASLSLGTARTEEDYTVDLSGFATGVVNARASVHDPSIIAADGAYYIFGSHMTAAKSTNLRSWDAMGNGYQPTNRVWGNLFAEGSHVFDYAGGPDSVIPTDDGGWHVWAPHVYYNRVTGKYMMYYCTSSTFNASNLCFGVSDSVEGPYEWQANLLCSGFEKSSIGQTDVLDVVDEAWAKRYLTLAGGYNYKDWPNCIDPTVFEDEGGRLWMVYGSWSGGIFLLELDPQTGLVIHPEADEANGVDPYFGKKLLGGGHKSIEGPYILWDAQSRYYYLFVSYGALNANGGYQIRVFRSDKPDGDYVDMNGARPDGRGMHNGFGLKLSGNYNLPSVRRAYMATGHNSAMIDGGKRYLCYHTRYQNSGEGHSPIVKQYALNREGWPCLLPYATRGETLPEGGFPAEEIPGRYYVINQGTGINAEVAEPFIVYLRADGTAGGESVSGTWTAEAGTCYLDLTLDGQAYSGVLCAMKDDANVDVTVFTCVGANESVWGVKYGE